LAESTSDLGGRARAAEGDLREEEEEGWSRLSLAKAGRLVEADEEEGGRREEARREEARGEARLPCVAARSGAR